MHYLLPVLLSAALTGCFGSSSGTTQATTEQTPPAPEPSFITFDPLAGAVAVPNDLLFTGSEDGTLNLPPATGTADDPILALNALDGWSTQAPFVVDVTFDLPTRQLLPESLAREGGVALYQVTLYDPDSPCGDLAGPGNVCQVKRQLNFGTDYTVQATPDGKAISVQPLLPLTPGASYLLAITRLVEDDRGEPLVAPTAYGLARLPYATSPLPAGPAADLQRQINSQETALAEYGVDVEPVIYSASFTVQSAGAVLATIRDDLLPDARYLPEITGFDAVASSTVTADLLPPLFQLTPAGDKALVGQAQITLPYYQRLPTLENCTSASLDCAGLRSNWSSSNDGPVIGRDPLPQVRRDQLAVEVQITLPNPATTALEKPASGWPVVLFSHGITRTKESGLILAGLLAEQGLATVAIDHPLHGSRSVDLDGDGFYEISASTGLKDLDLRFSLTQASIGAFVNLGNLLTVRDNLRQSVSDLLALRLAINGLAGDLDPTRVSFVGQSLGASIGAVFVGLAGTQAVDNPFGLTAAAFNVPGQGLAGIVGYGEGCADDIQQAVAASDAFLLAAADDTGYEPEQLRQGRDNEDDELAALWQETVSRLYPGFLGQLTFAAQTVVDSADPASYLAQLRALNIPLYLAWVSGDTTIPNTNRALGLPLSGTEPLIAGLQLPTLLPGDIQAGQVNLEQSIAVRFIDGKHSSLLDPGSTGPEQATTAEMQRQLVSFIASDGKQLLVDAASGVLFE